MAIECKKIRITMGKRGFQSSIEIDGQEVHNIMAVVVRLPGRDVATVELTICPESIEIDGEGKVHVTYEGLPTHEE